MSLRLGRTLGLLLLLFTCFVSSSCKSRSFSNKAGSRSVQEINQVSIAADYPLPDNFRFLVPENKPELVRCIASALQQTPRDNVLVIHRSPEDPLVRELIFGSTEGVFHVDSRGETRSISGTSLLERMVDSEEYSTELGGRLLLLTKQTQNDRLNFLLREGSSALEDRHFNLRAHRAPLPVSSFYFFLLHHIASSIALSNSPTSRYSVSEDCAGIIVPRENTQMVYPKDLSYLLNGWFLREDADLSEYMICLGHLGIGRNALFKGPFGFDSDTREGIVVSFDNEHFAFINGGTVDGYLSKDQILSTPRVYPNSAESAFQVYKVQLHGTNEQLHFLFNTAKQQMDYITQTLPDIGLSLEKTFPGFKADQAKSTEIKLTPISDSRLTLLMAVKVAFKVHLSQQRDTDEGAIPLNCGSLVTKQE